MGGGIACAMPFAMLGSAVDFGEWKTGIRSAGFLTAIGSTFCIKAGSGIGAAIPAWIMDLYGFLLAIIPLLFYTKFEQMEGQVLIDLGKK
ncbi:MAG: sugar (Glycoside-Pentoside-Hexuronide) transporter [Firmicutes bacterium]|nr:sugar (Glycoside-Pentoside-Hexuronide) transporter [Bacillota bacterium]